MGCARSVTTPAGLSRMAHADRHWLGRGRTAPVTAGTVSILTTDPRIALRRERERAAAPRWAYTSVRAGRGQQIRGLSKRSGPPRGSAARDPQREAIVVADALPTCVRLRVATVTVVAARARPAGMASYRARPAQACDALGIRRDIEHVAGSDESRSSVAMRPAEAAQVRSPERCAHSRWSRT
ncbi:MAG: hypothetical protein QOG01_982 [Pseudonocardiales bacterium]|nr:hypothetical protein [Pseudonocardiales bacterium]